MIKLSNGKQLNNLLAIQCINGQNKASEADLLLSWAYVIRYDAEVPERFRTYANYLVREQIINSKGQINWNLYEQLKY